MSLPENKFKAIALALASTALFALQFPILKQASEYISPAFGALFESLFTLIFCLVSAAVERRSISRLAFDKSLIASGILNGLALVCLFLGLSHLDPTTVSLIGRLYFVFSVVISVYVLHEPLIRGEVKWILLIIVGAFLSAYKDSLGTTATLIGLCAAILYPLLFALQNALVKKSLKGIDGNSILIYTKVWSLLPIAAYAVFSGAPIPGAHSAPGLFFVALSTFAATFLGLRLFYASMRLSNYRIANLVKASEPIFVLIFSMGAFSFSFSSENAIGFVLIILGSVGLASVHLKSIKGGEK